MKEIGLETAPEVLVESLTRRELEILALLADNLTNQEIAERLTLAASSVKWYTKQIFGKLSINNRRQVAARALQLGLLKTDSVHSAPMHNLPGSITPFVGRQAQIDQVKRMITDPTNRLITLTGAGGVGKTRLALKVAETFVGLFINGVWLVELASLNDPALVDQTVAAVFGLYEDPGFPPIRALQNYFRDRKLLLILDNCEHLIDACAKLVITLLRFCPSIQILVTSREALDVEGEIPFSVPSMTFPNPMHLPPIESLSQFEAVILFLDRSRVIQPDFVLTEQNAQAIARICKRLDGIPLALELAAALVKVLSVEEIATRLESSFQLLTGGFRTALPRHQTMRASIDWSYQLLSSEERILLRRFSVFSGGWALEAAESICSDDQIPANRVIDLLMQLTNKSLVFVEQTQGIRYYLLDAIWEYAFEKLEEAGEEHNLRSRHLAFFLKLAETAEPNLRGNEQVTWLDRMGRELANLRFALDWGMKVNTEAELRLGAALMWFWQIRGNWLEGLDWLTKGLSAEALQDKYKVVNERKVTQIQHATIRAKALSAAGFICRTNGEYKKAAGLLDESLAIYRDWNPDEKRGIAFTLLELAGCATARGEYTQATALIKESQPLYAEAGDRFGVSECLSILANNETDPLQAQKLFLEELAMKREIGDINGLAYTLQMLGELTVYETDFEKAFQWLQESLIYYRKVGNKKSIVKDYQDLAWLAWITGDYLLANQKIEEALVVSQDIDEKYSYAKNLLMRSDIRCSQGQYQNSLEDIQTVGKIGRESGDKGLIVAAQVQQGRAAWLQKDFDTAVGILTEALALSRGTENKHTTAFALYYLGRAMLDQGDILSAETFCKQSMQIFYELNFWNWDYIAYPLEAMASVALLQNKPDITARLFGVSNHIFQSLPHTLTPLERRGREDDIASIKKALGEEAFSAFWREGYELSIEQAINSIITRQQ